MLTERQKAILKAVIENYIKSAKPVSSWDLTEKHNFRVSSATIRNEFADLEENGYLSQPHTSAGRLPTERAYRFYVRECLKERELAQTERKKVAQELFLETEMETEKQDAILKKTAKILARHSQGLALAGFLDSEKIYQAGLTRLLGEPEFADFHLIYEAVEIFEEFDDHLNELLNYLMGGEVRVFVGRENPFGLEEFAFIGRRCRLAAHDGFLAVVGPTRMNYRKNISLIEYLGQTLENFDAESQ